MDEFVSVGEAARLLGRRRGVVISPRLLSDLLYGGKLDGNRCRFVGGRRMIPSDYLPQVEEVLEARGHLPKQEASHHA